jgi:hypothetical protein
MNIGHFCGALYGVASAQSIYWFPSVHFDTVHIHITCYFAQIIAVYVCANASMSDPEICRVLDISMFIYIHMNNCPYTCTHIHTVCKVFVASTSIYIYIYIRERTHKYIYMYIYVYICIYIYMHPHVCIPVTMTLFTGALIYM